jgi:hypothetical protein
VYFFAAADACVDALGTNSFAAAELSDDTRGHYNGGCFTVRLDEPGLAFLRWWQDRCIECCVHDWASGQPYGEEGHLDVLFNEPGRFRAGAYNHRGINVGPWHVRQATTIRKNQYRAFDAERLTVDGDPLICYHFRCFGENPAPSQFAALYQIYSEKLLQIRSPCTGI